MITQLPKASHACVGWVLILALLSLGGLDAAVCRGVDGHLGIETRVGSCCSSSALLTVSTGGLDVLALTAIDVLRTGTDGETCEDITLLQGGPVSKPTGHPVVWLGESVTVPTLISVSTTPSRVSAAPCTDWILCRLRSTNLLI